MKKINNAPQKLITAIACLIMISSSFYLIAQDKKNNKKNTDGYRLSFREKTGQLDTLFKNPKPDEINLSDNCVRYKRNPSVKYDYIKLDINKDLKTSMIQHLQKAEKNMLKYRMKVFSNAPAGTTIELLVGKNIGEKDYPDGTYGHFRTKSSSSGKWEELEFEFIQTPQGSSVSAEQINQITLLFNPDTSSSDFYYFDLNSITLSNSNAGTKNTQQ